MPVTGESETGALRELGEASFELQRVSGVTARHARKHLRISHIRAWGDRAHFSGIISLASVLRARERNPVELMTQDLARSMSRDDHHPGS